MKYRVAIVETLSKGVEVEAGDIDEAREIVEEMYEKGEIILTADDFKGVVFD
jgi:hypothetical protein